MRWSDKLKQLTRCGMFTAIALTIFMIEARLPSISPIPGMKLGLANGVTMYVAYSMGVSAAGQILFSRILLGAMFAGQFSMLLYSAMGGLFSFLFLALVRKKTSKKDLWYISPCCALCHNLGQVLTASQVMGTTAIFYFLPYLSFMALGSGFFIGLLSAHLLEREDILTK